MGQYREVTAVFEVFLSLFSQYLLERTDRQIIETEYGFATYTYTNPTTVYIEDLYIVPEARKQGLASKLTNQIVEIAKEKGCNKLFGSVVPSAKTATESMQAFLAYGMKIDSSSQDFILLSKEL